MFQKLFKRIKARLERPRRYKQLFNEIRRISPQTIMEVGTWNGNRATQMITLAQQMQPTATISYFGFDLFELMNEELFKQEISKWPPKQVVVEETLKKTGASIHLYPGYTHDTLPAVVGTLPKMDFVFIDGGHSLETVENDWNYTKELMHEGTVVIFDDYWPEKAEFGGSKKLVDSLDKNVYDVSVLPIVDRFKNDEFGTLAIQFAKVTLKR